MLNLFSASLELDGLFITRMNYNSRKVKEEKALCQLFLTVGIPIFVFLRRKKKTIQLHFLLLFERGPSMIAHCGCPGYNFNK